MRVFCDSNLLIAASILSSEHHIEASSVLRRVRAKADTGFIGAHSLAEAFSVLTRLPLPKRLSPEAAARFLKENIIGQFEIVALTAEEYVLEMERWAGEGIGGGQIYDALLLACAAKVHPELDRIYTFNVRHFRSLAAAELKDKIEAPSYLG